MLYSHCSAEVITIVETEEYDLCWTSSHWNKVLIAFHDLWMSLLWVTSFCIGEVEDKGFMIYSIFFLLFVICYIKRSSKFHPNVGTFFVYWTMSHTWGIYESLWVNYHQKVACLPKVCHHIYICQGLVCRSLTSGLTCPLTGQTQH